MTQTADSDHAYFTLRAHFETPERRKNRRASAKKRRCACALQAIGQCKDKTTVCANAVGEASVVTHANRRLRHAEILVALKTEFAREAGTSLPADSDSLSRLEMCDLLTERRDCSDDFVARDERISAPTPIVVDQVNVAKTNSTMRDFDLCIKGRQIGCLIRERSQWALRLERSEC